MTLPASGPISMSEMANEVGLSLPISLNHPRLLALVGKSGPPISFSDFYGRTGRFDERLIAYDEGYPTNVYYVVFNDAPFFGGSLNQLRCGSSGTSVATLTFDASPNWTGNILVKNNTTGANVLLSPVGSIWQADSTPGNLLRPGVGSDFFTLVPND